MLTINPVRSRPVLASLERLIGPQRADRLRRAAAEIQDRLDGGTLWHVNSTPTGGGVAEMLRTLLPLYGELGVRSQWAVVSGDDAFFRITKRLGVALYGSDGDGGPLGPAERAAYLRALAPAADRLVQAVDHRDVVILHDHQTAGLVPSLAGRVASVHWRCHVGVDEPTDASERGWDFLTELLDEVDSLIFSVADHVPARLRDHAVRVQPPFISPFDAKNVDLPADTVRACLAQCGLDPAGEPARSPLLLETAAGDVRLRSMPTVISDGARQLGEPLVTQVSRWDRLKDMAGVLTAVTDHVPVGHLALVGPDPAAIADDVEQGFWYADCLDHWRKLSPAQRRRVSLVSLPMTDPTENALLVNAVQRASDVVVQKSLAEGFGLTVAEAMWKSRVVVGSAVGGIRAQITDGVDGFLLTDPADLRGLGQIIATALSDAVDRREIGERAHRRVRDDFLPDREVTTTASMLAPERMATR
ncbi:glycosyltransferase [Micromonospora sp. WMMD961]|uniref:glycosyltransferase n=1 Tax=Micromonospora sp. WMMD961 TaxID=3016100 RepID=UPI002416D6B9|nr:glycosyltransferase [Micromonospora sp. WMMD961]MDG4780387.1 glycosyltransferase [Micromonospora sp. WMMD961]